MKRNFRMKRNAIGRTFAAIMLGTASLVSAAATTGDDAVVQTAGSMPYVSGGVGKDSIDKLTSLAGNFNLKLIFALKSGDYLSNVKVAITDARGKSLLDTTSDGPWFLTKLSPGNYQIAASYAGATEKRTVAVGAEKLKTVDFRWASD